jgi:hypothetical protein
MVTQKDIGGLVKTNDGRIGVYEYTLPLNEPHNPYNWDCAAVMVLDQVCYFKYYKFGELKPFQKKDFTIEYIQKIVCEYANITIPELHWKTRMRKIVQYRQIAMYFSKNLTEYSFSEIGAEIGGKDHATAMYACKTVRNLIETDKNFKLKIIEIENKLKN